MTYTVHVEWMGIVIIGGREDNPDGLIGGEDEGVLSSVEISGGCGTCKNLFQSWGLGWEVRDTINVPLGLSGSLVLSKILN